MLPGLVGIAFNWTARGIFLEFISPRLWWREMRHSLSEAQREGLFLSLRYIVITFDFLGINLVIWAQLQVLYLILVLTNGMNRIKKTLCIVSGLWLIYWTPVDPHGFSLSLVYDKMLSGSFLKTLVLAWQNLLALLMAIWLMVHISLWIVRISLS